jgi:hypothetical protein
MDLLNAVWRFSFGGDKDLALGQQALEKIQDLVAVLLRRVVSSLGRRETARDAR